MYHSSNNSKPSDNDVFSFGKPVKADKPNIQKWLSLFLAKWYWFVLLISLGLLSAFIVIKYTTPVYMVNSKVLIKSEQKSQISDEMSMMNGFSTPDMQNFENQVILLKTESQILRTLEELDFNVSYFSKDKLNSRKGKLVTILDQIKRFIFYRGQNGRKEYYANLPFKVRIDRAQIQPIGVEFHIRKNTKGEYYIKAEDKDVVTHSFLKNDDVGQLNLFKISKKFEFGKVISGKNYGFTIDSISADFDEQLNHKDFYFVIRNNEHMVKDYEELDILYASKGASIAYMSITGTCLAKTKVFLNKLMEVWIQTGLDQKNLIANNTIALIDQQLYELGDTLGRMGAKLQRFRTSNKVVMPTVQVEAAYSRLQNIESESFKLQMQSSYFKRLKGYLNERGDYTNLISPASVGLEQSVLNENITQLAQVRSALFQYKGKEKLNNPYLEKLERQEATLLASLYENINSQQEYIDHQLAVLAKQKQKISREQNLLPGKEQQFMNIKRNFDLTNNLYTMLLEKRVEAQIQKASNLPDNEIIEKASFAGVIAPQKTRIYQLGVFLGLVIPALILLLKDYFNNKIQTKEDVEDLTSIPVIGNIDLTKKEGDILTQIYPRSPITEAFRALRTRLDYMKNGRDKQTILVTSSASGEGKSFFAINLAGILALAGRKTIVLGFDLRKPQLKDYLDISNESGITTYLIGKTSLDKVIHKTQYKNLDCIVSGPIPPYPAELIDSKETKALFEELEKRYDCIVIDSSPMGIVTDALLLSAYSSVNLFVVRQQFTNKHFLEQNIKLLGESRIQNVGLVMNGIKTKSYKHGYNYGYGYTYEKSETPVKA